MIQVAVLLLVLGAVFWLRGVLRRSPIAKWSAKNQSLLALGIILFLLLMFTGRLGVLVPVLGTVAAAFLALFSRVLPLVLPAILQHLPRWLQKWGHPAYGPAPTDHENAQKPSVSTTQTAYLTMWLDHQSGTLSGKVTQGPMTGRALSDLSLSELAELYRHYRNVDPDSARLLSAYIERIHGDRWEESQRQQSRAQSSRLSRSEAQEILGVTDHASRDEIIEAHRRLIQKMHPDRGGSDYLAAKINQAKDVLLEH
jgi:hypothetical protein